MQLTGSTLRRSVKAGLAHTSGREVAEGVTILIYHRVGGGTGEELDLDLVAFEEQLDVLARHRVVSLDAALNALEAGDRAHRVVLTFDDGFAEVHRHVWPRLQERGLPFTVYVATGFAGTPMRWEGSTSRTDPGRALGWDQLADLSAHELCTVGNHTHGHVRPEALTVAAVDRCSDLLEERLGVRPRHFAYPWGVPVPRVEAALRARFRSAVTGRVGRNLPGTDPLHLRRVPVRRTDPRGFFEAKLRGRLWPERTYATLVDAAKRLGIRG